VPERQIPILPGMNEGIEPRHLPIGSPRLLQNIRVRQGARFEPRPGQASVGASGLPASATARWTSSMAGEPVVCVDDAALGSRIAPNAYRRNSAGTWNRLGRHGVSVPERRFSVALEASGSSAFVADRGQEHTCAVVNGLLYLAYADVTAGTTVFVYQIDPDGVVLRKTSLSDAAEPRLVYANSVLYLITREPSGSGTDIEVRTVSNDMTLGPVTTLGSTLAASTARFDAAPVEAGTTWVIAYRESATEIRVRVMSGTTSSVDAAITTTDPATCIGVAAYAGEYVCVAYLDGTDIEASVLAVSNLAGNNFTVRAASGSETYLWQCGVVRFASGEFYITGSGTDQDLQPTLSSVFMFSAAVSTSAVTAGPYKHFHFIPASKPWTYGSGSQSRLLVWAQNGAGYALGQDQPKSVILDVTSVYAHADAISYEHAAGYEGSSLDLPVHVPEVPLISAGRRIGAIPWDDPGPLSGIDVVVWSQATPSESMDAATRLTSDSGGALYISGGALAEAPEAVDPTYSVQLPENGFPHYPAINLNVGIATGGSLTVAQDYTYVAVYRWQDSAGRVHRGAPSETRATSVSNTPTGIWRTARVRVSTLAGSTKVGGMSGSPVAEIYRSWNGGPYYYVGSTGAIDSVSVNDVSSTYDDTSSDSTVEANRVLDTDLGILPTEPPSGARIICQGGLRLFVVGWRPNVVQFSKLYVQTAPWEFVDDDAFRIQVPHDITALGWLDGAVVIFTARRIYLVTGDGPNDQGVGVYSDPRELPATVGADSPHVVETPNGLMYYGGGTIWLLPRGFGPPQPVGDQIQKTLAAYPYLRGAARCVTDDYDLTHFLLANGDTPSAGTLVAVWNNTLMAWSRDQLACDMGAIGSVDGVFHSLLATWSALSQVPVRKLEGSAADLTSAGAEQFIETRVAFGEFRPWGPLGWGRLDRFQIHGEALGACAMNVVAVTDGLTGMYAAGHTTTATKNLTGLGQFYTENQVKYPPGGAYSFEIYSSKATGVSSGLVLHSVAISHSEPDGLRRVTDEERF
jgi:hypothetical protein